MSLYTVEELAERCEVTVEFIGRLRKEGGQFHPAVTVTRIAEARHDDENTSYVCAKCGRELKR